MTNRLLGWASVTVAVAALAVMTVPAAAGDIRADVPFSFTVNGKTLPAGTYNISTDQTVVWVRGTAGGAVVLGNRVESRKDLEAKLVFYKYGDRHILREAWMGGGNGRALPKSQLERELAGMAREGRVAATFERIEIPLL